VRSAPAPCHSSRRMESAKPGRKVLMRLLISNLPPAPTVAPCCLTHPHITQGQYRPIHTCRAGGGDRGRCPLRPALPVLPTYSCCHRAPVLWSRLPADLLLFAFVHAGCAHVSLASRTSQRRTNAYLTWPETPPPHTYCPSPPV
jgi:hypothetical protein